MGLQAICIVIFKENKNISILFIIYTKKNLLLIMEKINIIQVHNTYMLERVLYYKQMKSKQKNVNRMYVRADLVLIMFN